MKIMLLGILLLTFSNIVSAQPIFVPIKGERAITRVKDIKKEDVDITNMGNLCGEYFLSDKFKDDDGTVKQRVSFKVPVGDLEYTSTTKGFARAYREQLVIKTDDKITAPTAKWKADITSRNGLRHGGFIIRISPEDLRAASCLSPSP